MVEADEKKSQKPPTADELAQAEHYEAMMDAVARDDDEDYDLEDGRSGSENSQPRAQAAVLAIKLSC